MQEEFYIFTLVPKCMVLTRILLELIKVQDKSTFEHTLFLAAVCSGAALEDVDASSGVITEFCADI